jgi:hypothetical protein
MKLYYGKTSKHEKNITRLWFKIMPYIGVEWIEGNEGNYIYLYMLENLAKGKYFKEPSWAHS